MRKVRLPRRENIIIVLFVFGRSFVVAFVITLLSLPRLVTRETLFGDPNFPLRTRLFALAAARQGLRCHAFYFLAKWPLPWLQLTDGKHSFLFKDLPTKRLDEHLGLDCARLPIKLWPVDAADLEDRLSWRVFRVVCVGYNLVAAAEITHRGKLYDATAHVHPHNRALFERVSTVIGWPLVSLTIIAPSLGASHHKAPGVYLAHADSSLPFEEHLHPHRGDPRDIASSLVALYTAAHER